MNSTIKFVANCAMNGVIVYCISKAAIELKNPVVMLLVPLSTMGVRIASENKNPKKPEEAKAQ